MMNPPHHQDIHTICRVKHCLFSRYKLKGRLSVDKQCTHEQDSSKSSLIPGIVDEEVDQGHNPVEHDLHVRTTTDPISLLRLSSRTVAVHASHHPEGAQQVEKHGHNHGRDIEPQHATHDHDGLLGLVQLISQQVQLDRPDRPGQPVLLVILA